MNFGYPRGMKNSVLAALGLLTLTLSIACRSTDSATVSQELAPSALPEIRYYVIADT